MADKNLDEWDPAWEHAWEEEEDIYSSLEALDMVRFLHQGKYHSGIIEKVIKDSDEKVSGVTIRLLDGDNTVRTYHLHVRFEDLNNGNF